ncbi:hypothetical protein BV22DRAFT_1034038 [Leucogyrophana mollusca]|uniref:Uncharacterized protein n=1 Tax=Leucogyrophana mollusca TaxID=85980 RepID=A0ACB8BIR0_9AGAM|nr:hypothetical protein BV22DRAFT_1034038 [Leucogyrophana mollusca]
MSIVRWSESRSANVGGPERAIHFLNGHHGAHDPTTVPDTFIIISEARVIHTLAGIP